MLFFFLQNAPDMESILMLTKDDEQYNCQVENAKKSSKVRLTDFVVVAKSDNLCGWARLPVIGRLSLPRNSTFLVGWHI